MGAKELTTARLPQIAREHWHEIPLPSTIHRRASHGLYKLFNNVLTDDKIEEYSIIFQNTEDYQQYLESFAWRQREQYIVSTKYFQNVKQDPFCGTAISAKVYLEHTPYRLSSINNIPTPDNMYVLASALAGFHKLYALIGYFRANEDMIGIDEEGRVKVWLNSNFSKNYLFGPHYVQGLTRHSLVNNQQRMIMEILALVDQKTFYESQNIPSLSAYFQGISSKLTFDKAQRQLVQYSRKYKLTISNYFISLINRFQESNHLSEPDDMDLSTFDPYKISQGNAKGTNKNVVHYIDPQLKLDQQKANQLGHSENKVQSLTRLQLEYIQKHKEHDTTKNTINKISFKKTKILYYKKPNQDLVQVVAHTLPQISFSYSSSPNTNYSLRRSVNQRQTPSFTLPQSKIAENSLQSSARLTRRMIYSDIHEDYELDEQLAQDLIRYLNG